MSRAGVGLVAFELLRRHVLQRPENRALCRQIRQASSAASRGCLPTAWRAGLRQPEIEQLRARLRQHDVAGLQVAMDDAFAMRLVERVRNLNPKLQRLVERQCALRQSLGQRLALQVLHDQEVDAVLTTDVVDVADVRMTQGRECLGLALESLLQVRVRGDMLGQDLDGDRAIETRVAWLCRPRPCRPRRLGQK